MAFEQKDDTGALFKNDKGGNEKRPDYRGSAKVNGIEYEVSAWIQESKAGKKYMSLKFGVPYDKEMRPRSDRSAGDAYRDARNGVGQPDDGLDGIPW